MTTALDDHAMREQERFGGRFDRYADQTTRALGSLPALMASVALVVGWALTGPLFHYSDTWQLFINTTTTVITFWMVFVIQNSANRQSKATQLKLDELIRALTDARNEFVALDHATEQELAEREQEFGELAQSAEANRAGRASGRRRSGGGLGRQGSTAAKSRGQRS
jgi:low affinity Fe/Cu permease